ncbi:MAG: hypothetical protein K2N54_05595 [Helicobacter sp.]|nr:hypothetical protein [Helicobacter sp.]
MTLVYFGFLLLWFLFCATHADGCELKYALRGSAIMLCITLAVIWAIEQGRLERKRLDWRSQFANAIVV